MRMIIAYLIGLTCVSQAGRLPLAIFRKDTVSHEGAAKLQDCQVPDSKVQQRAGTTQPLKFLEFLLLSLNVGRLAHLGSQRTRRSTDMIMRANSEESSGSSTGTRSIGERAISGGRLPLNVGFGTCLILPQVTQYCVDLAINAGYRVFDTAQKYENEYGVGQALRAAIASGKLKREDVIVTTKVWVDNMGSAKTAESVRKSASTFDGGIDLVLIHWPGNFVKQGAPGDWLAALVGGGGNEKLRRETWEALEDLQAAGSIKQIGVANFGERHLKELLSYAKVRPMVNQFEIHPYNQRAELVKFCQAEGILVEAYSPLGGKGNPGQVTDELLRDPILTAIAGVHEKTVAQVILRWHLQRGITPIPKSKNQARIEENIDVFDFELSEREMQEISKLDRKVFAVYDADELA